MTASKSLADQRALNEEGRALWDQKSEFWDNLHGDRGNRFHRELVGPAVERLLALQPGERMLDVACGNGTMARRMAELRAVVTAVDFSPALIERAQARGQADGPPIAYEVVDATDEGALVALGAGRFDAVVCTMALMDMPVIAPLYRAVVQLLAQGGRFVFATSHPAFNSNNPIFTSEKTDVNGQVIETHALKLTRYLTSDATKAAGAPGEPNPHYYYHRPLHELLGEAFAAGLVLDGLEEPGFTLAAGEVPRPLSWESVADLPPILAARLRRAA